MPDEGTTLQSKHRHKKKRQEWVSVSLDFFGRSWFSRSQLHVKHQLRHSPTETGTFSVLVGGSTSAGTTVPVLRCRLDKQNLYVLRERTSQALMVSPGNS